MCDDLKRTMIIAMITMRMMKVAIDKIIDVIAMRHRFMSAARAMHVTRLVAAAAVVQRASIGIFRTYLNDMLVNVIAMLMMEVAIMQIVDVIAVTNRCMATAGAMPMVMIRVMREIASVHRLFPFEADWLSVACSTAFSIMFRTWLSATE